MVFLISIFFVKRIIDYCINKAEPVHRPGLSVGLGFTFALHLSIIVAEIEITGKIAGVQRIEPLQIIQPVFPDWPGYYSGRWK
jgi:hypothetical protein